LATFGTRDLLVLDAVQREEPLPEDLKEHLPRLLDEGIVERIGRGRGSRLILSRGLYDFMGKGGDYTRRKGLDRETNKALLLQHIIGAGSSGSAFTELQQVLPALSRRQVQGLLEDLRNTGKVVLEGKRRYALWRIAGESQDQTRKREDGA
jgi:ATP-dependent DNA helicase RecG